jgi:type IV secretory system conjugative DNA transfer VirD4/TraG family protein
VASLLTNLFGRGKEPFWQLAYTNLVKFIILLHKLLYDYVTLFDVYECAISRERLEAKIRQGEKLFEVRSYYLVEPVVFDHHDELAKFEPAFDSGLKQYRIPATPKATEYLTGQRIRYTGPLSECSVVGSDLIKREQFEAVKRWFYDDWCAIDQKLRTSVVEGISVFLSLFDDNPKVKRTFCPPKQCYDPELNQDYRYDRPLPGFAWLIECGKVCALNFPTSFNPGLARALGAFLKMDFQRAVLNRIPLMAVQPDKHYRQIFFICDEYHLFATTGESDPSGDEKAFSLSRQAKLIPIVATQSVSSLKSTLSGETWRTLLQTFRTKIFLALSDDFSTRFASELCGKEDKLKVNCSMTESSQDAKVSFLFGKTLSDKATLSTSKSFNVQRDYIFDQNIFAQLKNQQSVTIAYDGVNPHPPAYCYLKPYHRDPNKSYFQQLADGDV